MRIISGKFKGKSIIFVKNKITRPLKDSVKENLFNILDHSKQIFTKIKGSNILDLYSGFGSFGLECFSRGAKHVTFVENNLEVKKTLKENLIKLNIDEKKIILLSEMEKNLQFLEKLKFNIIFLDPPFSDLQFVRYLEILKKRQMYTKDHIIVIHRKIKTFDNFQGLINIITEKKYGRSKIIFSNFS